MMARNWEQQPPEAFRAFVEQFAAVLAQWLHEHGQQTAEPDPLFELSQLRVLADLFVQNRTGRDKGFAQTVARLPSTLDAWWERFKQEHDGLAS